MATLKFDQILQEFSRRIGDRLDSAFTPGAGAFPDAAELDAVDAISYINKALSKMVEDILGTAKGDIKVLASVFPELVATPITITFASGVYTIGVSPQTDFDFYKLFGAYILPDKTIRIYAEDKYVNFQTANYPDYEPTADDPAMVVLNDKLYIFPTTIATANIIYIKKPINPTDGSFLAQNGTYDSPFHNFRNSRIAEIAVQLYLLDKKPK